MHSLQNSEFAHHSERLFNPFSIFIYNMIKFYTFFQCFQSLLSHLKMHTYLNYWKILSIYVYIYLYVYQSKCNFAANFFLTQFLIESLRFLIFSHYMRIDDVLKLRFHNFNDRVVQKIIISSWLFLLNYEIFPLHSNKSWFEYCMHVLHW